jgi:hypothetical protein
VNRGALRECAGRVVKVYDGLAFNAAQTRLYNPYLAGIVIADIAANGYDVTKSLWSAQG